MIIRRHSARAILIDDLGRLVLIRRTRPGRAVYWTTAGGGVEADDASLEAAMHRELFEELGATATGASRVFLASAPFLDGIAVAHFFVARLASIDIGARTGPEFADPSKGAYDVEYVCLRGDDLMAVDLQPSQVKEFILANRVALLAEAGLAR